MANTVKLTSLDQLKIALLAAKGYTDSEITGLSLGTLASKNEVGYSELTTALKQVIDGKAEKATVTALVGADAGKSARAISAEEVAKLVAGAPASYDTLKEIADWIANDTTGSANMANDISALNKILKGIGGPGEQETVIAYITNALSKYVMKAEGNRLMTAAEGTKLSGIADGATKVEKSATNGYIKINGAEVAVYSPTSTPEATETAAGLMSAEDKKKLNGMVLAIDSEVTAMCDTVFGTK